MNLKEVILFSVLFTLTRPLVDKAASWLWELLNAGRYKGKHRSLKNHFDKENAA